MYLFIMCTMCVFVLVCNDPHVDVRGQIIHGGLFSSFPKWVYIEIISSGLNIDFLLGYFV